MIRIEPVNLDQIIRAVATMPGGLQRAIPRAVRRTLRGARQDAGRKIAQRYTIPARRVTSTIKTRVSGFNGEMTSSGSRFLLERFKHTPKSRPKKMPSGGVFAQVVRGQGGNIRRAFIQRNGGIYERTTPRRYPLRRFTGPSAPGMLGSPIVSSFIEAKMGERIEINLMHEAAAVLGGYA